MGYRKKNSKKIIIMFSHFFMAIWGVYLHNPHFFGGKISCQEDGEVGGDEEDEVEPQLGWIETSKNGSKKRGYCTHR